MLGPPTPWGQAGKIWADLVKERTQGRINIKLYPGVSLIQGDQTREFSAIRQGVIDLAGQALGAAQGSRRADIPVTICWS